MDLENNIKIKFRDKYVLVNDTDDSYGEGCFGKIYSCKRIDDDTNTPLCVKIIPINIDAERIAENEIIIKRTIDQLKSNQQQQANTIKVFDIYFDLFALYIIMEKCDEDLSIEFDKKLDENSWYTEEEVFDILQQIIEGLKYLHSKNILHHDVKPENILIKYQTGERKIYKISDFGICDLIKKLTQRNEVIRTGSPNYTAPQIFESAAIQSQKCDIFSFGILIYQICYKTELPYDCSSMQIRYKSLQNLKENNLKTKPLSYKREDILRNLIQSMIVYDEDKRISYQDLFNHAVVKNKYQQNTGSITLDNKEATSSKQFDRSINFLKKTKNQVLTILERLQLLLDLFLDKFKICCQLIEQLSNEDDYLMVKLNIYLIANHQLLYALALIYIRPLEMHPSILKYNDNLMLIEKLRQAEKGILLYQQDTQGFKKLADLIQQEYHKFKNQFIQFTSQFEMRKDPNEFIQFLKQSKTSRIELKVLIENIKTHLNIIPQNLKPFLDQVIKFESLAPVNLQQKDSTPQYQLSQQIGQI
ncbi:unnamed protein product (macronuclear) [Paramecium tetraurelia]|uniref:Protein kinase domain-containing protein n=1 Tax=Paramecium tetraurelia TaxID=5888 RepID=A0BJX3_PARTE|nr:uncharacterized protein GSPATT00029470001 [Paramecium tetraurelia]CAK58840.1 unnamed protein product [Paramecium tetraurelia]|eukprot:XP_001426238.1 hypothetical protein (macronuclear) [Paramecium tetraurelia strain d4-2]